VILVFVCFFLIWVWGEEVWKGRNKEPILWGGAKRGREFSCRGAVGKGKREGAQGRDSRNLYSGTAEVKQQQGDEREERQREERERKRAGKRNERRGS
jgi:hypothetical protein